LGYRRYRCTLELPREALLKPGSRIHRGFSSLRCRKFHIIRHHILPTVRSIIIVMASSWLGIGALWVSALGFLGLGLQPPTPEWGAILNDGKDYVTLAWWVSFFRDSFYVLM
jgi:ABC-type dipeptide/oligopeptide/nickel transport system permease subunit